MKRYENQHKGTYFFPYCPNVKDFLNKSKPETFLPGKILF